VVKIEKNIRIAGQFAVTRRMRRERRGLKIKNADNLRRPDNNRSPRGPHVLWK
jgi:hypothetical protein